MITIIQSEDNLALDEYFFKLADRALKTGKRMYAILPSQATFSTEKRILDMCGVSGIMHIEVLSPERLYGRILERTAGRALPKLDAVSMGMSVKNSMIRLKDELSFEEGADGSLHAKLAGMITALKSEDITPEMLRTADVKGTLKSKLNDIAMIYEDMGHVKGMDTADVAKFVATQIPHSTWLHDTNIAVFGFDVMTQVQTDIVRALAGIANVVCGVNTKGEHGRNVVHRLIKLCPHANTKSLTPSKNRNAEISHIYATYDTFAPVFYTDNPRNLHIHACKDERAEVATVAASVLELHCKQGVAMSEMAVIAGNPAVYAPHIADIFGRCSIPYFLEGKRAMGASDPGIFVTSALALATRVSAHSLMRHLNSGFLPVTRDEISLMCAYIKMRGLKAWQLLKPLGAAYTDFEELRSRAFTRTAEFLERMKAGKDMCKTVLDYAHDLDVRGKLEARAKLLGENGLEEQANFTAQLFDKFEELLINAGRILKNVDVRRLKQVIESALDSLEISVVPPRNDEVTVGDLTHSIIPRKRAMFILGANDGVLPAADPPDALIGQRETELIKEHISAFPSKLTLTDKQSYVFRALTCTDSVTLTYSEKLPPSLVVHRLKSMFPAVEVLGARTPVNINGGLPALARELSALKDAGQTILLPSYLHEPRSHELLVKLLPHVNAKNTTRGIEPGVARELYGALRTSVSRIENHARCSYKYFLDYGLRPHEPKEYEEDAGSAGTYIHALMDGFTKRLGSADWRMLKDDTLKVMVDSAAADVIAEHNDGIFTRDSRAKFMEERMRREVYFATMAVRENLKGTDIKTVASEKGFGFAGELTLDTARGKLLLRGKIDRIDLVKTDAGNFVRVVDYKSGTKTFSLTELFYGLNIQLMVYLMAVKSMYNARGTDVVPAGGLYFGIKMPVIEEGADEQSRATLFDTGGFVLSEDSFIDKITPESGLANIGVSLKRLKSGELRGMAFSRKEISMLTRFTQNLIARAVECIYDGDIDISPGTASGPLPCVYCPYISICRFEGEGRRLERVRLADFEGI